MLSALHKTIKHHYVRNQTNINYYYAFFLVFITPLSIPLAIYTIMTEQVTQSHLVTALLMYCLTGLGISVGFHRLLSHRAFETKPWLKYLLLVMGSSAMQGSPASWASIHIQHHVHADKKGDPHTPFKKGFWYSHCGWIFKDYQPDFKRYGKWLLQDKIVRHVSTFYFYYSLLCVLIPIMLGGWVGLIWGGLLRLFISSHATWCVNSVCHLWGKRDYDKSPDTSRNNVFVALLSFGEGWHNNHHRYMQMPFFSHKWYQIDFGKWFIQLLCYCKLAWGLKLKQVNTEPAQNLR